VLKGLFQGDALDIPVDSQSIDAIYSSWGFFTAPYENKLPDRFFLQVLREFHRVLKTGGVIRISPVLHPLRIRALLKKTPGLWMNRMEKRTIHSKDMSKVPPADLSMDAFFIELRRIN
jgi:ubiquinone/menaquinone biosynthesis C-methylase UbiE